MNITKETIKTTTVSVDAATRERINTEAARLGLNQRDMIQRLVEELEKKRLPHLLPRVDYPTGTVDVDISDANDPKYIIHTDVAWSHMGTIQSFLDATPADCLKVFDVNLRQTYYHRGLRAIS